MYCSACDEVLVDNITIPATGVHTEVSIPGREATCTETGLTAKRGDRLITLVTCASHTDNGRFVAVAQGKTILKKHPSQTAWGGCFLRGIRSPWGSTLHQ